MSQHPRDTSLRGGFFFCERTLDLEGVFSGLSSVKREAQWLVLAQKQPDRINKPPRINTVGQLEAYEYYRGNIVYAIRFNRIVVNDPSS